MSEERLLLDYLNDILENISDIKEFTSGMTRESYSSDKKTIKAVVRSLEVIGEAANKIPQISEILIPKFRGWKSLP